MAEAYETTERQFQWWMDNREEILLHHLSGTNLGFSSLDPTWDLVSFDIEYLREAMGRSQIVSQAEETLLATLKMAADAGLPPADWQRQDFPEDGYGYTSADEKATAESFNHESLEH